MNIKAVIGANYGDEGKGLMVDHFTLGSDKSLVILTNGGAQRGHTVNHKFLGSHVFHNYGSGTLNGADTYCSKFFMINPLVILKEYDELKAKFNITPLLYVDKDCRFTTPWDMMVNQFDSEDNVHHKTCGMGIFNTSCRYLYKENNSKTIGEYISLDDEQKIKYLKSIRELYRDKISVIEEKKNLYYNDNILNNFFNDLNYLLNNSSILRVVNGLSDVLLNNFYKDIVFENAQGLNLSWSNDPILKEYTTPSITGVSCLNELLKDIDDYNLEVCYVTRSYLTRHGDGPLSNEIDKQLLSSCIDEKTNIFNKYQGDLRYGYMDSNLENRILTDFNKLNKEILFRSKMSIAITHLDEVDFENKELLSRHNTYKSYSPYADKIIY